ncbi:MAG TPA: hypothetical protein VK835_10445 [Bacteroidia bacterium]|jgi:hypothetical protein|nr:hypothetical protein [Bacteroidia bacterium]
MATLEKVTLSPNSISFKGKSIDKKDIYEIEYKEPKGLFMAIFSNIFKYAILMIFVVGIPLAIYEMYLDVKFYRVIITLRQQDNKGKKKIKTWWMSKAEHDFIRENY